MAITFVGSGAEVAATGGANLAVPVAAGIQADDFLWVPASSSVATAFATNAMSGFTRAYASNSGGGSPVGAGYYKRATGSETGTITLVTPGGISIARMFVFRGVDWATGPFDVAAALPAGWSTSVTAYVIDDQVLASSGVALLLHTWSNATSGTWTQPAGYTEVMDSTAGATANATSVAYRLNQGPGATGTRTVTRSAAVRGGAAGVALRPAPDVVTGTHAADLPLVTSTSSATVTNPGTHAATLPLPASTSAGTVTTTGTIAAALPLPSSAAAADVKTTGNASSALPMPTSTAVADVSIQGTAASTLPLPASLAIIPELRLEGTAASTLPLPTSEAEGYLFLDTSNWRDITVTVGTPAGHPFQVVGPPSGHRLKTGTPST